MAHNHPKPPLPTPKPRPANPNSPATKDELNEWADHLYHYLVDLREIVNKHIHDVEHHMADSVPPAHSGGRGEEKGPPAKVLTHIAFPPEPPWEME